MHVHDLKNQSRNILIRFMREMGAFCCFASLFLCPDGINSRGGSGDGSFVRAAALHPFQMGGSFRIILPSTPTSTAELMRWSRSSAHKHGVGTDLLPLTGRDQHVLQSLFVNSSISSIFNIKSWEHNMLYCCCKPQSHSPNSILEWSKHSLHHFKPLRTASCCSSSSPPH